MKTNTHNSINIECNCFLYFCCFSFPYQNEQSFGPTFPSLPLLIAIKLNEIE